MEHVSAASALANQSEHSNSSQVLNGSTRSLEYSDAELVLSGVAMAILVLAIVFGKLQNISSLQLVGGLFDSLIGGSKLKYYFPN